LNVDTGLDQVLEVVRARTNVDFSLYRRNTIRRRIRSRMVGLGVPDLDAYLQRIRASETEAQALLDRLAIKVSRFYRNAPAFELLRHVVLPELATRKRPLRIWSAGCGYGEEPHTLAMLLEEAGLPGEIVATDIDRNALVQARQGIYGEAALRELPAELRERFLTPLPGSAPSWRVRDEVRGRIAWVAADILTSAVDAEGFDLACCRNLVIYLEADAHDRVLEKIAASLRPGGYLFMGEAEWPSAALLPRFTTLSPRWRVFRDATAAARRAA
jgi:chemotaxis protein methyltransferase CheR